MVRIEDNLLSIAGWDTELMLIQTPFDTRPPRSPALTASIQGGLKLEIQGQRGLHYQLDYTDTLAPTSWQPWQSLLLTNETQTINLSNSSASRFFRLQQND